MIKNQPRHQNCITIAEPAELTAAEGFNNSAISSTWKGQRGSPVPQTAEGRAYDGSQAAPLKPDDIVHAMVTSKAHEYLALETRLWRKDRRTYIVTNYTLPLERQEAAAQHNEVWEYYPDDRPLRTLFLQGDSRAALAPFLAHRRFGDTYKWLLYGDDDTLFFNHALIPTLQDMDPDMPYFLTDHMWWQEYSDGTPYKIKPGSLHHPHEKAPVCVPCHYTKDTSGLPFPSPPGCPCTPEVLCNADVRQEALAKSGPRGACNMRVPIRTFSMHGGAGAALSIGLMRAISLEWFEDCVHNQFSTGGDAMISLCLWEAGFGHTNIDPLWHPRKQKMFDVSRIAQGEHDNIRKRLAVVLRTHLQKAAGLCLSDVCQLEWNHTVSLHLRSRMFPSHAAHAELSRVFTALAAMAMGEPNPFEQHSLDVTMQMTNEKVLVGLQRLKRKAEASNTPVMDKASIAAANAVAHSILDEIWKHTDASPP